MAALKVQNKLKLQLQMLELECTTFNFHTKEFNELSQRIDLLLNMEDKKSPMFITALNQLMDEARKLSSHIEELNLKETDRRKNAEIMTIQNQIDEWKMKDLAILHQFKVSNLKFPKPDVSLCVPGYVSAAIISNIVNAKEGIFHILAIQDMKDMISMLNMHKRKLVCLDKEPPVGSTFVVVLEENIRPTRVFRVPADPMEVVGDRNIKLLFLESGEFLFVAFNEMDFFELPDNLQHVPSFAKLCKIIDFNVPNKTLEEWVNNTVKKRFDYEVVGVEGAGTLNELYDVIIIKLLPTVIPPFVYKNETLLKEVIVDTCNHLPPIEQREPQIIEFPEVGTLIWIVPLRIMDINSFFAHYTPVSNILTSHDFTGISPIPLSPLSQLIMDMNGSAAITRMKPYGNESNGDAVLARINGVFQRAKVINSSSTSCEVFLLDFASTHIVSNSNIRKYEDQYSTLPSQAIKVTISNIQFDKNKSIRYTSLGMELLKRSIVGKCVPALLKRIVKKGEWIEVKVYNSNGNDIGDVLVNEGYARPKML